MGFCILTVVDDFFGHHDSMLRKKMLHSAHCHQGLIKELLAITTWNSKQPVLNGGYFQPFPL